MNVAPPALAREVRVVRGGDEADRFGRAREQVADVIREALQLVRADADLVVDDVIMCRAGRALQPPVCLEVEVVFKDRGRAAVDDRPWTRIAVRGGVGGVGREEACVMPLAADDDGESEAVGGDNISSATEWIRDKVRITGCTWNQSCCNENAGEVWNKCSNWVINVV